MTPDRVGPYQIEKKIGAGGMGSVYLGRHEESGQVAAVKILPATLSREEGFVVRFAREIEALQQLKNPHIVALYDSGVDGETYYYAMEYVDGATLNTILHERRRLPWREVIDLSVQVCSALKAAHNAGIIHRDLKPSNLMVTDDGQVKLTDFGVAQVFAASRLTATGGVIGTAEFMSPEQARGVRATKASDLYSLGAVMYAMLTGRPPFSGKTTVDVMHKHQFAQFDSPRSVVPDIPRWLDDVVCQLLEKDPAKRFPDAYVLSLRLKEIPKKVDLSRSEQALVEDEDGTLVETVVMDNSLEPREPGAGTLMRDVLRAEIERSQQPGPLGRFFDNPIVLIVCLVLLIVGGVLWFRDRPSGTNESESAVSTSEAVFDEILDRARQLEQLGQTSDAERLLKAQATRLKGELENASPHRRTLLQLQRLEKRRKARRESLRNEMTLASKKMKSGDVDGARRIWTYIAIAFADDQDDATRDIVKQAKTRLEE